MLLVAAINCFTGKPILLLDEPTSNLDTQGTEWYLEMVRQFTTNRITIIGSNQENEYAFCDADINLEDYK